MDKKRILVVDDQNLLCIILSDFLKSNPEFTVVGTANNGKVAIEMALQLYPDIILMDVVMPIMGGIEASSLIKAQIPECKIIAFTSLTGASDIQRIVAVGVDGLLPKDCSYDELLESIQSVSRNESYISEKLFNEINCSATTAATHTVQEARLSPRELDVVQQLAMGANNKQIATHIGISVKTVETYRTQAMQKLQIATIAELTRYAIRTNLVSCK